MLVFSLDEADWTKLRQGVRVPLKVNGKASECWITGEAGVIFFRYADEQEPQRRELLNIGFDGKLHSLMCR